MKKRKITLLIVVLMAFTLVMACKKTDSPANTSANSSPEKNSSSSSGTTSTASNRFVGTWEEEPKGHQVPVGEKFTEDGKVTEPGGKLIGEDSEDDTYTVNGDTATIYHRREKTSTATLESDNRMLLEGYRETSYLIRKTASTSEGGVNTNAGASSDSVSSSSNVPISGGVLNGVVIFMPKPQYPASVKAAHASSTVRVQVTIDETGKVISAHAADGYPLLQQAAVDAAYQARFNPTKLNGKPFKVTGVLTYNFVPE